MLLVHRPDFGYSKSVSKAHTGHARGPERLPEDRAQRLQQRPFCANALPEGASVLLGIWAGIGGLTPLSSCRGGEKFSVFERSKLFIPLYILGCN